MKLFAIASIVLASLGSTHASAADIQIGQNAVYSIETESSQKFTRDTLVNYDVKQDSYIVSTYLVDRKGNPVRHIEDTSYSGNHMNQVHFSDLDQFCKRAKGKRTRVEASGYIFSACYLVTHHGASTLETWYAPDIPFGYVKQIKSIPNQGYQFMRTYVRGK